MHFKVELDKNINPEFTEWAIQHEDDKVLE